MSGYAHEISAQRGRAQKFPRRWANASPSLERGAKHGLHDIRLPHETEIIGMRTIRRSLGIVAEQVVARNVVQALHACRLQLFKTLAQRRVVVGVMLISYR